MDAHSDAKITASHTGFWQNTRERNKNIRGLVSGQLIKLKSFKLQKKKKEVKIHCTIGVCLYNLEADKGIRI